MIDIFKKNIVSRNDFVCCTKETGISLYVKREDLLHPEISGNKFRKLKYNLIEAKKQGFSTLLTFGGAYSNHIVATAAAGKMVGLRTIGVVRGDELGKNLQSTLEGNPSLKLAHSLGMRFHFVSREDYRRKATIDFLEGLTDRFGKFYLLPEGGTNQLAVNGCKEIITEKDTDFDYIACSVGTGGTLAGIIEASALHQEILGFCALKADFVPSETQQFVKKNNWQIITNFHFGGYGKVSLELIRFINDFKREYGILLDPIYTGKMMFGIFQLIDRGYFRENTRILAVHTGGLQGIAGMNNLLTKKGMPKINA